MLADVTTPLACCYSPLPRSLFRANTTTVSESSRRAASTSVCDRAPSASLPEHRPRRLPRGVSRPLPHADRRLRTPASAAAAASPLVAFAHSRPTQRRRRGRAAPRASRCADRPPPASSSAHRSCSGHPGALCQARRRVASDIITPLCLLRRPSPRLLVRAQHNDDSERAPSRERVVVRSRAFGLRCPRADLAVGPRGVIDRRASYRPSPPLLNQAQHNCGDESVPSREHAVS